MMQPTISRCNAVQLDMFLRLPHGTTAAQRIQHGMQRSTLQNNAPCCSTTHHVATGSDRFDEHLPEMPRGQSASDRCPGKPCACVRALSSNANVSLPRGMVHVMSCCHVACPRRMPYRMLRAAAYGMLHAAAAAAKLGGCVATRIGEEARLSVRLTAEYPEYS